MERLRQIGRVGRPTPREVDLQSWDQVDRDSREAFRVIDELRSEAEAHNTDDVSTTQYSESPVEGRVDAIERTVSVMAQRIDLLVDWMMQPARSQGHFEMACDHHAPRDRDAYIYICMHTSIYNSYKYLGLMISSDGSIRKMIEERVTKAKRASFVLRQALSTSQNVSVNLYMSLFDKQIEPILLYGCPLWGMPSSNCTIKIRGIDIKDGRLRETLQSLFASLGSDGLDIISCRFHRKEEVAFVTLGNILYKITLFSQYFKSPTTITMEEVEKHADPITERLYSTSCKYALGISKYSSTTLALGEHGRFPLQHRIILLTLMYWFRLEQGTKNPLLNIAYLTMTKENHQ